METITDFPNEKLATVDHEASFLPISRRSVSSETVSTLSRVDTEARDCLCPLLVDVSSLRTPDYGDLAVSCPMLVTNSSEERDASSSRSTRWSSFTGGNSDASRHRSVSWNFSPAQNYSDARRSFRELSPPRHSSTPRSFGPSHDATEDHSRTPGPARRDILRSQKTGTVEHSSRLPAKNLHFTTSSPDLQNIILEKSKFVIGAASKYSDPNLKATSTPVVVKGNDVYSLGEQKQQKSLDDNCDKNTTKSAKILFPFGKTHHRLGPSQSSLSPTKLFPLPFIFRKISRASQNVVKKGRRNVEKIVSPSSNDKVSAVIFANRVSLGKQRKDDDEKTETDSGFCTSSLDKSTTFLSTFSNDFASLKQHSNGHHLTRY